MVGMGLPSAGPVVSGSGLRKAYGSVVALDGVDVAVNAGTIHGLVGPNGAGKTTLLGMLFGLIPPDAGDLTVLGGRPGEVGGIAGFVEEPRFYTYLDALANLRGLALLDGHVDEPFINDVLDQVGLSDAKTQKVKGFSLGMRQRLGLAAALLRRPQLLIVDEPGNGIDPAGLRELRALFRRLVGEGVTVLLSSHDMRTVEDVCDELTVLSAGRVAFAGTMEAMRAAAPDPLYRVSTADDAGALTRAHLLSLDAREDEDGLLVRADVARMDEWVLDLGARRLPIRSLTLAGAPLESFFFALTEGGPQAAAASDTAARST
jgi:ABC-2 type transport system ATP-binding protein